MSGDTTTQPKEVLSESLTGLGSSLLTEKEPEEPQKMESEAFESAEPTPPLPAYLRMRRRSVVCSETVDPSLYSDSIPSVGDKRGGHTGTDSADPKTAASIVPKSFEDSAAIRRVIRKNILMSHLDDLQIQALVDAMFPVCCQPGQEVIRQGEDGDNFYIISQGVFHIFVRRDDDPVPGKLVFVGNPGDSFGELALMYNCPRAATVISQDESKLWAIDRITFRNIVVHSTAKKMRTYVNFLEKVPILAPLNKYEKIKVADALESISYEDKTKIITQGDPGDAFYILEQGEATVYRDGGEQSENVELKHLNVGDYFGEMSLLTDKPRAANVESVGYCRVLRLDREAFLRLMGPCEDIMKTNIGYYRRIYETFLEEVELLASITREERAAVADALETQFYSNGDAVVTEGDVGDRFYIVVEGNASAIKSSAQGDIIVKEYVKGDYFGEVALLTNQPRKATVRAKGHLKCATLSTEDFNKLLGPCGPVEKVLKRNMQHYQFVIRDQTLDTYLGQSSA